MIIKIDLPSIWRVLWDLLIVYLLITVGHVLTEMHEM